MTRHEVETGALRVLRWVVIVGAVTCTLVPLLYTVLLSIRPLSSIVNEPLQFIPSLSEVDFTSYLRAVASESSNGYGLGRFMANSLLVALGTTILSVGFSALGAYAAVRLRFLGRDTVNGFFLGIYVLPAIVLAVPLFVMFSRIGLRGTLPGLIIIYLAQTIPLSLYMLRNYFQAVPASVEEAAMIDGCGRLGLIRRVVLPIATPGLAATGLYVFMIAWNEFLFALLFLVDTRERWTVSLGLAQFDEVGVPVTVLMAGSIAITLPVVVLFFAAERMLVAGLTAGAEKG